MRRYRGLLASLAVVATVGCGSDSGSGDGSDEGADDQGSDCIVTAEAQFEAADESACMPLATDFVPGSDADPYATCVSDDGEYHLIEGTPSSVARVEAYDEVVALLRGHPSADDFTAARTVYAVDEGLESRVLRREDLHYPAIPEADFDPDFEDDKQCSSPLNVAKHSDRCAGPANIAPIIDAAFVAGMTDQGEPEVHAARIEAAGLWFLFLSVYKEANTCADKAKDCDSSWAYYTGAANRAGGIGLSAATKALTELGHNRVFDGVTAVRCWRDLYPAEDYPSREDLDAAGEQLLSDALEQLDQSLWYAYARIVRDRLERQDAVCGVEAEANWAFLQVAGPVLDFEASARGSADATELAALWAGEQPTAEALEGGVEALDAVFGCG